MLKSFKVNIKPGGARGGGEIIETKSTCLSKQAREPCVREISSREDG